MLSKVYNSRKILLDLMKVQNYNVEEYSNFSITEVDIMLKNEQLDMILERSVEKKKGEEEKDKDEEKATNKIYIKYFLKKSMVNLSNYINDIIADLFELSDTLTKEDTLLIVMKDDVNDSIRTVLKHIWETDGIFIIIISIKRLQFNILDHVLVPPHRIISKKEEEELFKRYNIMDRSQLPEISRFDPVAQVIGIRPGQICEINRPSKAAVNGLYYRMCV